MAISALAGSMPSPFTAFFTASKFSGAHTISHALPSSLKSSAPASSTAARSFSSSIFSFSRNTCPFFENSHATLFSAARLPACLPSMWRISPTVRFLLSVRV